MYTFGVYIFSELILLVFSSSSYLLSLLFLVFFLSTLVYNLFFSLQVHCSDNFQWNSRPRGSQTKTHWREDYGLLLLISQMNIVHFVM